MSSDENDIAEFAERVASGGQSGENVVKFKLRKRRDTPDMAAEAEGPKEVSKIIPKMWSIFGKTFSPCEKATKVLPAGHYQIDASAERGIFFVQKEVNLDELLILPDTASDEVVKGIEHFWTREEHYRKFKFLWKRGILLWGPPGSGKTSTVQIIADRIVQKDGLSIYATVPTLAVKGLDLLRYIEPHRPIVVILEDIDAIIERHSEAELLALLDGELQVDNAVFIATTNYPEVLDKRIINRPSRFDIVKKIGMPSDAARKMYLEVKNPRLKDHQDELALWVKETKDFSIAHLKELIISIECLEIPFESCIKRLKSMHAADISSTRGDGKFGFTA